MIIQIFNTLDSQSSIDYEPSGGNEEDGSREEDGIKVLNVKTNGVANIEGEQYFEEGSKGENNLKKDDEKEVDKNEGAHEDGTMNEMHQALAKLQTMGTTSFYSSSQMKATHKYHSFFSFLHSLYSSILQPKTLCAMTCVP